MSSRHSQSNLSEADLERADIRRSEMMAAEAKGLGDVRLVKTVNPKTLERDFGFTAVQKGATFDLCVVPPVSQTSVIDPCFQEMRLLFNRYERTVLHAGSLFKARPSLD